jgi:hypothetical protein
MCLVNHLKQIAWLFDLLVRIDIHVRFHSTRCKTMYSRVIAKQCTLA